MSVLKKIAAVLTTEARDKLPSKVFAGRGDSYPVHDKKHVVSAIAYAKKNMSRSGPSGTKARGAWPKIKSAAKRFGVEY